MCSEYKLKLVFRVFFWGIFNLRSNRMDAIIKFGKQRLLNLI